MDMQEVSQIASYYDFRAINDGEDEQRYRRAISQHLRKTGHVIESHEVLTGRYETSQETLDGLNGAVIRESDGRILGGEDEAAFDHAFHVMGKKKEADDGLASAMLAAFSLGINPLDLLK